MAETIEQARLRLDGAAWRRWGPYLAERAWGTVREDYSANGDAWNFFPHDHARSRAYRWSEDGLAGICDDEQRLCFAVALWNEADPILKERFFGLTNGQGNHGEDVKEYYSYLDATPTSSYLKMLYKYPQAAYPYADLVQVNGARSRQEPEYELIDTGIFAESRYFDVVVEYAKAAPDDVLIRISATNRGRDAAPLHIVPTLWFRDTWSWSDEHGGMVRPLLSYDGTVVAEHPTLGAFSLTIDPDHLTLPLFTENETNLERCFGVPNRSLYVKDGINDAIVDGLLDRVNPAHAGTRAAYFVPGRINPGDTLTVRLRLRPHESIGDAFAAFDAVFADRIAEAEAFYRAIQPANLDDDNRLIQRQAYAGMLWSKQFYHFDVERWLVGDPGQPPPPPGRSRIRNADWPYLFAEDIISMPDTWEYPWFAAWDLAFHCLPLARLDPEFAKGQLLLLGRENMQHPNGQVPAYEWNFSDVNPPVLAWAALAVFKIAQEQQGAPDHDFLERIFHKLLLNFTWWVNRKDAEGNNVFQGGFLGLDNIGVFDRSAPLPSGVHLEQSDGTAWMAMFCINMLAIAIELSTRDAVYEDIAYKFFEHFLHIARSLNGLGGVALWDDRDEFFYDVLHRPGEVLPLRVRSMIGIIPLFAVTTILPAQLAHAGSFRQRVERILARRPDLAGLISRWYDPGSGEQRLLAICRGHRLKRVLRRVLDPAEFLSDFGVRSLSREYRDTPFVFRDEGLESVVRYQPAESESGLFGGNSNWRGPIWFPVNFLLIEALRTYHAYFGDEFLVEAPTGSGEKLTLAAIADLLSERLIAIFRRDADGRRPVFGPDSRFDDEHWRNLPPFAEYFNGDTGAGVGASHQTGWTGLVAELIQQVGERSTEPRQSGVQRETRGSSEDRVLASGSKEIPG